MQERIPRLPPRPAMADCTSPPYKLTLYKQVNPSKRPNISSLILNQCLSNPFGPWRTSIQNDCKTRYEPTDWTTPHPQFPSPPSPSAPPPSEPHPFPPSLQPKPSVICSITDFKPPHFPSAAEEGGILDPAGPR